MLRLFRKIQHTKNNVPLNYDPHWSKVTFLADAVAWTNAKDGSAITYEGYPNIGLSDEALVGRTFSISGAARAVIPGSYTNLGASDFTIEAFAYVNPGTTGYHALFNGRNGPGNSSFSIMMNDQRKLSFIYYTGNDDASTVVVATANGAIADATWYHIAVTKLGQTIRLFINGVLVATATTALPMFATSGNGFIGGYNHDGAFDPAGAWQGKIAGVRITKDVARYTENFTPEFRLWPINGAVDDPSSYAVSECTVIYGAQYSPTFGSASKAFDSDVNTSWFSYTNIALTWVGLTYPVPVKVNKSSVNFVGSHTTYGYSIQYSHDGLVWNDALVVTGINIGVGTDVRIFPEVTAKHWRYKLNSSSNDANREVGDVKFLFQ